MTAITRAYVALSPEYVPPPPTEGLHMTASVTTPGLNQWTTIKPLAEAVAFEDTNFYSDPGVETQYGYDSGLGLTQVRYEVHRISGDAGISEVWLHYRRYRWPAADAITYYLLTAQAKPITAGELLSWTVFDQITPNTTNGTQDIFYDASAILLHVDRSQTFWISAIAKHHYDGDSPSTWPDATVDGSVWLDMRNTIVASSS